MSYLIGFLILVIIGLSITLWIKWNSADLRELKSLNARIKAKDAEIDMLSEEINKLNDEINGNFDKMKERLKAEPGVKNENIDNIVSELIESGIPNLLEKARERIEKPLLSKVMLRLGENQSEAAKILGISRNTLRKMLEKYNMLSKM